jgi:hypothetical protein
MSCGNVRQVRPTRPRTVTRGPCAAGTVSDFDAGPREETAAFVAGLRHELGQR